MIRRLAAIVAATAMILTLAVPALAGGWAEIVPDAQTTEPPVEGQPVEIGFLVLQHGQTPAPWEVATVHFTNASTGATIDIVAQNDRPDGHFVVSVALPEAGNWSWQVTLRDLLVSEQRPVAFTVTTASGQVPAHDPSTTASAIERLDGLLRTEQVRTDRLIAQMDTVVAERDELATRMDAAEIAAASAAPATVPLLAVLTLAVLAGATAGFAMSWLSGRNGPSVTFSPDPREADRV